jgi:predicted acylesterase/phospholipase RssA/CRP-like cAMP-binding protein
MNTSALRNAISAVLGDSLDPSTAESTIGALADIVRVESVPGGSVLFRAGDAATAMGIIVSGRLRVGSVDDRPPTIRAELGAGSVVGELGLLGDGVRTADVWAARDSEVAWLDEQVLNDACRLAPTLGLSIARFVADRSNRQRLSLPASEIAVLGLGTAAKTGSVVDESRRQLVDRLTASLGPEAVTHVSIDSLAELRNTDRLVVVCGADDNPEILRQLTNNHRVDLELARAELVLIQPPWAGDPAGTHRWLASGVFSAHHHVRRGSRKDTDRASRRILGRGTGLVLGGGGARGLAHLGVVRVLEELDIPIDFIGGTSMGAIMGAVLCRLGPGPDTDQFITSVLRSARIERDFAVPKISILRGRALHSALEPVFGNRDIEDLWIDWFCTSTNVRHYRLDIHDHGPILPRLMATSAVPGLFPPVVDEYGAFHLDGGLLDNLPAKTMRERGARHIVAVDVSARTIDPTSTIIPKITESLHFSMGLSSAQQRHSTDAYVDVLVCPEVQQFGLTAFSEAVSIIEAGSQAARKTSFAAVSSARPIQ